VTQPVIRVFISSPSDTSAERRRAALMIERLNGEFAGRVTIEAILWEEHFYSSHAGFQDQIAEAATCHVVIAVFGARLGTPLPDSFPHNPTTGQPYPSGTAYEVLSAIQARKSGQDVPNIYVFRYPRSPEVQLDAPDRAEIEAQWAALKSFFETWFRRQGGEFIAAFHEYTSTDDFATQAEGCLRDFLRRRGFVAQSHVWDRLRLGTPFPGLAAFEADRRAVFFGRDRAITRALDRLRAVESEPGRLPFLLVIGASGSGKSSLLRAGLMPRLTMPGTIPDVDLWRDVVITPGRDPFLSLAEALFADTALGQELRAGTFASMEILARQLAADPDLAVAPLRAALALAAQQRMTQAKFVAPQAARVALGVDQAERLFTETATDIAERFATLLVRLVDSGLATVILILRSDAYGRFQSVQPLLALREAGATFDLVPPSADELEQIISGPVQACDPPVILEPGLAARLAEDAKGGDALPLLQVALARLYDAQAARNDGILRHVDYLGMGQAVTSTAQAALEGLPPEAVDALPALVAAMVIDVTTDPVTLRPVATTAPLDRSLFTRDQPARDQLLDAFIARRLLTADGAGDNNVTVRPTHEALLRIWPRAVELVAELGPILRVRRALTPLVRDWQEAAAPDKPMHLEISPALLEGAQQLVARLDVDSTMAVFVAACAAAAEARRRQALEEQERRVRDAQALAAARRRTAQFAGAGLVAALLLAGVASWQGWVAREAAIAANKAEHEANTARDQAQAERDTEHIHFLAMEARRADTDANTSDDIGLAGALALESIASAHKGNRVAEADALETTRSALSRLPLLTLTHGSEVWSLAVLSDGRLASGAKDGTIKLWPKDGADEPVVLTHGGHVWSLAVLSDGRLASGGGDGKIKLWPKDGTGEPVVLTHGDQVRSLAVLPDERLASGGGDGKIKLWPKDGTGEPVVLTHGDEVLSLAALSDGRLASGGKDGKIKLWPKDGAGEPVVLTHGGPVTSLAVLSDGRLASGSKDGTVKLWPKDGTGEPMVLTHGAPVASLAVLSDGRLASGGYDGKIKLWPKDGTGEPMVLTHGGGPVQSLAVLSDGRLASGGDDGKIKLWPKDGAGEPVVLTHGDPVWSLAVLSDGRLASGAKDGTIKLWPKDGTGEPVVLKHGDQVWSLAVLSDGRLASGGGDGKIKLWPKDGTGEPVVLTHGDQVLSLAVLSDGRLASGGGDGKIKLWPKDGTGKPVVLTHGGGVSSLAVLPDGRLASGGQDRNTKLWPKDGTGEPVVLTHGAPVTSLAVLSDGRLASGGGDGKIKLWPKDGAGEPVVLTHGGLVLSLAVLPDRRLASGGQDRKIKLWLVEDEKLFAALCLRAGRNLSKDEWARYIGSDTPWQPSCRDRASNWRTPD